MMFESLTKWLDDVDNFYSVHGYRDGMVFIQEGISMVRFLR